MSCDDERMGLNLDLGEWRGERLTGLQPPARGQRGANGNKVLIGRV